MILENNLWLLHKKLKGRRNRRPIYWNLNLYVPNSSCKNFNILFTKRITKFECILHYVSWELQNFTIIIFQRSRKKYLVMDILTKFYSMCRIAIKLIFFLDIFHKNRELSHFKCSFYLGASQLFHFHFYFSWQIYLDLG